MGRQRRLKQDRAKSKNIEKKGEDKANNEINLDELRAMYLEKDELEKKQLERDTSLFLAGSNKEIISIYRQLMEMVKADPRDEYDSQRAPFLGSKETKNKARELGEKLFLLGGQEAMYEVVMLIPKRGGDRSELSACWDGIGTWRD